MTNCKIINMLRHALSVWVVLALAACGGGGGGSTPTSPPPPPPPPVNQAPTISGTPATAINAGSVYSFVPTASDPDGDPLTFSIENVPVWALFDKSTGELSGLPTAANLGDYADIRITVSDGNLDAALSQFSLMVAAQKLGRDDFETDGDVFMTADGYQSVGTLTLDTGERTQSFENSDLVLTFDEEGNLADLSGESDLPKQLSDTVSVDAPVRAVVGMMTGAEINADEDFGITLVPDINYMVFYIGASVDITIGDRNDPGITESVTLETPLGGQIIMITDPTDPMLYHFASQALIGTYGEGESLNGLIPFSPSLDFPGLDSFNGHKIEKGSMGIGFKVFDFFEVEGTRVTKEPQFTDIDWEDPLDSAIEYKAGINGSLDFAFSVLSVGIFSFELAETSATLDVGLDRQQAAIAVNIAPDVSWVPDWFHFVPTAEANGEAFVNGNGDFSVELNSTFKSTIPAADVAGGMFMDADEVTLAGMTVNDGDSLEVSISFRNEETVGRVKFPEKYAASIKSDVSAALDREIAKVEERLKALEEAVADYEFEVSLRGFREAIPAMVDQVTGTLNAIPGEVRTQAYNAALNEMRTRCQSLLVTTVCIDDLVDEVSIANSAANRARDEAASATVSPKAKLAELKRRAEEADDESLRAALKQALAEVYANRTYSKKITVKHTFPSPFGSVTVYNKTHTRQILTSDQAAKVLQAHDNVHLIQETSDIMISAQRIFDELPTEEVINQVKQEVEDNVRLVPVPEGLGYRARDDRYEAIVTIDGTDHDIDINVLKPSEVQSGVSDLLADILLGDAS